MVLLQRDLEAEMRRLKLELKQTMDMYSSACKEAISAKNKVLMLLCKISFSMCFYTLKTNCYNEKAVGVNLVVYFLEKIYNQATTLA